MSSRINIFESRFNKKYSKHTRHISVVGIQALFSDSPYIKILRGWGCEVGWGAVTVSGLWKLESQHLSCCFAICVDVLYGCRILAVLWFWSEVSSMESFHRLTTYKKAK